MGEGGAKADLQLDCECKCDLSGRGGTTEQGAGISKGDDILYELNMQNKFEEEEEAAEVFIVDGSVDWRGRPAVRANSGTWIAGIIILLNQGLATLAFFGVGVNLVLLLTRVLDQTNADAANNVSRWTGTVYLFSLVGAFLSDSYWGRYKACTVFQVIFAMGLGSLSLSTYLFLIRPKGCGKESIQCWEHSRLEIAMFYISIYLIALGYGGYQPNIATFGADQFDGGHSKERNSKVAFFSYFYLALNLGSLISNTILGYFEDGGLWDVGFWVSTGAAFAALVLFLVGTPRYRNFQLRGNPFSRFCQVLVAASLKCRVKVPPNGEGLCGMEDKDSNQTGHRKILHTEGFRCLDKAAVVSSRDLEDKINGAVYSRWRVCPIIQVEEVKCVIRLIPVWLCTIMYSVVFTQMASLFVEQGAAMKTTIFNFRIPPASMSSFDILSVAFVIFLYRRVINPFLRRLKQFRSKGLTELDRMGIGLVIAVMAMVSAGIVECYRLKYAEQGFTSSLSIFWQVPQYAMIGASEVFMYVGQLEFFNAQTPDGLKSFGSALCMTSMSLGNYVSNLIVSIVMSITSDNDKPGWIPGNLNKGHLDRFYFLLAILATLDLVVYIACAKWYSCVHLQGKSEENDETGTLQV
ncbi:protein NRT1/ PTR FAMILY 7.3 [Neltuma alba]|uniref:protein NRT1/ PTR FAMILY 7.3 n=1 Tax=Neltuma alba TaxID=207710 RepID=UPI0010A58C94|nr:protein NRT1/ PTR FAMILY 7.3-like [Prosopis alba]